jgi:photosystem II stability/assembly factor-like uncharacterized protein/predicted esterase
MNGPIGSFHDRVLAAGDGVEDRFFFLHVPAGYDCGSPAPLLVDFHGTAGGDRPEEAYQNPAIMALAESEGVIVVRPRSRSSDRGGERIFRWDQNAGDLDRNVTFTQNLVAALQTEYAIDPERIYAAGFSSGSNMTTRFLAADARGLFRGLAPIAGGIFPGWPGRELEITPFADGEAPRLFLATGFRDYLWDAQQQLADALPRANVPAESVLRIEYDVGHDLYPWHFAELWAFLDGGEAPTPARPIDPWTLEALPSSATVVEIEARDDGSLVAAGVGGKVWARDVEGAWTLADTVAMANPPTGICIDGQGRVFVAGYHSFVVGTPMLELGPPSEVPELVQQTFGSTYLTAVGCNGAAPIVAGGYWNAAYSDDVGASWHAFGLDAGGYNAQLADIDVSDAGTVVGVGYFGYIGRADAGATSLALVEHPAGSDWLTGVVAIDDAWWAVGDYGTILHSIDDGASWQAQSSGTSEDLYAVAFVDASTGAAVGRRGTVVVTHDGGASWEALPTGIDDFLGAVGFVSPDELVVAGTRVLRASI